MVHLIKKSLRTVLKHLRVQNNVDANGIFSLAIETNLGISANALYGNDTLSLGLPGNITPSLVGQNVGGVASKELFMGYFGLNPAATNFSTFNNPVESYMSTLKAQSQIPSLSYGYTAGNQYRGNGVPASLTLGGYDASLFEPNDLTIEFNPPGASDLTININTITVSSEDGNTTLSSKSFPAFIDSTLPYLYLPTEVCRAFEAAFGITYDNSSGIYLVNDTLHAQLLEQNANVTFALTNTTGNTIVDIVLPYQAFDLTAEWPLVETTSRYFPLKRAANNSQTTLGRAFLQEAYLIADYEHGNFSIYQRTYTNAAQCIRAISPSGNIPTPIPKEKNSMIVAAAVGGSVGGAILVTLIVGFALLIRQRSKRIAALEKTEFKIEAQTPSIRSRALSNATFTAPVHMEGWKSELDASTSQRASPELDGSPRIRSIIPLSLAVNTNVTTISTMSEVQGLHEMEANEPVMAEVAGSPVEVMMQEAIDDILQQQIRAWPLEESSDLTNVAETEEEVTEIVSPLSPDEIQYPDHRYQDAR